MKRIYILFLIPFFLFSILSFAQNGQKDKEERGKTNQEIKEKKNPSSEKKSETLGRFG